jgi:hypothetical protein
MGGIYPKLGKIKVELQEVGIKKTGKSKYTYYELSDFLPTVNALLAKHDLCDNFSIRDGYATLRIYDDVHDHVEFSIPFIDYDTPVHYAKDGKGMIVRDKDGEPVMQKSMQDIQNLGALNTYYKRYLYLNAFGIVEGEVFDREVLEKPIITEKEDDNEPKPQGKTVFSDACKKYGLDRNEMGKKFGLKLSSKDIEFLAAAKQIENDQKKEN